MPRNTISILLRFLLAIEDLNCSPLTSQDLISLDNGSLILPLENMFDAEAVEGFEDQEGDEFKALVTANVNTSKESGFYNQGLQQRIEDFRLFLQQAHLKSFLPVRVIHCAQSHGIVITSKFGSGF
jgi:hypothetical protein